MKPKHPARKGGVAAASADGVVDPTLPLSARLRTTTKHPVNFADCIKAYNAADPRFVLLLAFLAGMWFHSGSYKLFIMVS